jgi:hypothetical protein
MDQDIFLNALSAADVKAAYESNADTNAFTDAFKTKLETTDVFDDAGTYANLRAQATTAADVGLGNVTNESKATMFTSPTFTGTVSGVTATHVGLSSVENYSIATQAEAEAGSVNNKYMTPLRTSEAISFQTSALLTSGQYTTSTDVDSTIAGIGGDGLLFDNQLAVYNLDYADNTETAAGQSATKVLTPATTQFIVIDGGEFV